jgi:TrmH family RNA methyltransferase
MGSEAYGLSRKWLDEADELIKIPMNGKIDSLNVSASAAVVVFEALRQRNFRK